MNDKPMSAEESLDLIQRMITSARHKVLESGFHFFLWGILVVMASLGQYLMIQWKMHEASNYVWLAMPAIGVPSAFLYEYRNKRKASAPDSPMNRHYTRLWMGFGVTLFLIIFSSVHMEINPISYILGIVGLATFVSGSLLDFMPLRAGALVFWIASVSCIFVPNEMQLLINAGATALGYLIPAYLLYQRSKTTHV